MKTIGILGGMSCQSSAEYYRLLNDEVKRLCGGWNSAELILCSVNFADVERYILYDLWEDAARHLVAKAQMLEKAGADFVVIASNTMHRVAPQIEASIGVPFLHIVDPTAEAIKRQGLTKVGLLGTKPTMEHKFHRSRFEQHGIAVITPSDEQCQQVHSIIRDELVLGIIKSESRQIYIDIMAGLAGVGAEGIVLGCTEIDLLIKQRDTPDLPLFDTTALHCQKIARWSLGLEPMPAPSI